MELSPEILRLAETALSRDLLCSSELEEFDEEELRLGFLRAVREQDVFTVSTARALLYSENECALEVVVPLIASLDDSEFAGRFSELIDRSWRLVQERAAEALRWIDWSVARDRLIDVALHGEVGCACGAADVLTRTGWSDETLFCHLMKQFKGSDLDDVHRAVILDPIFSAWADLPKSVRQATDPMSMAIRLASGANEPLVVSLTCNAICSAVTARYRPELEALGIRAREQSTRDSEWNLAVSALEDVFTCFS